MSEHNFGAHPSHCCRKHGCKYGDDHYPEESDLGGCPVVDGRIDQEYRCEDCPPVDWTITLGPPQNGLGTRRPVGIIRDNKLVGYVESEALAKQICEAMEHHEWSRRQYPTFEDDE
jgi:hypothetical protein